MSVGEDETNTVTKNWSRTVKQGNATHTIELGDHTLRVNTGKNSITVPAGEHSVNALSIKMVSNTTVEIRCGAGSIKMNAAGNIDITGTTIKINGTLVDIKGGLIKLN
jgi:hypothetical protein